MDFSQAAASLYAEYDRWMTKIRLPCQQFDVMGFSQGAAMAYALAAFFPQNVRRVIALAGFLPIENDFPGRYSALQGKPIYVAHGSHDDIVPIERAEEVVLYLQSVGAKVSYCASATGHKLSVSCLSGLEEFVKRI